MLRYFDLRYEIWGKDLFGGEYPWLTRAEKRGGMGGAGGATGGAP
jgi:hypothetical protein